MSLTASKAEKRMVSGFIEPSMTRFSSYMMRKLLIMMRMWMTRNATSVQNRVRRSSCVDGEDRGLRVGDEPASRSSRG